MGRLTVAKCRTLTKPGIYGDGGGLYLRVRGGSRAWILRATIAKQRTDIGLGSCELVTLAEARDAAIDTRRLIRAGVDPRAQHQPKVPTVRQAADATRATLLPGWKNEQTPKIWDGNMEARIFPAIGDKRVDAVTRGDVSDILMPMWTKTPTVAKKSLQFMRQIFEWCLSKEFVSVNVAAQVKGGLGAQPRGKHYAAVPWKDVPPAFRQTEASNKLNIAARACLRFQILTAVRPSEARRARWDEIDVDAKEWRIPDARMKEDIAVAVPLSDAALAVLAEVRQLRDKDGFVFPSPIKSGQAVNGDSLLKFIQHELELCDKNGEKATLHGFRDSFGEWTQDTGKPQDVADACLAHKQPGVRAAYFRSYMIDRRRVLMGQWAAYVTGERATVARIGKAG